MNNIKWSNVINSRRSTRSFEAESIGTHNIDKLKSFIDSMTFPFEHTVETRIFTGEATKRLYTVFNAPKENLAFITETDYASIAKAGFVGELAILYATSLGLSTCWYGHYTLMELEKNMPHLGEHLNGKHPRWSYGKGPVNGRRTICVTPVAYWKDKGLRLMDRIQLSTVSFKRKQLDELLSGGLKETDLRDELKFALDLARKAPSAGNGQFWRFEVSKKQDHITITIPIGYKHPKWEHPNVETGIAACHIWLALEELGVKHSIQVSEDVENKRALWQFDIDWEA